eukprot:m.22786 g.22786  ORF g.22786 m.22786 type:complete len:363 (-) comp13952_c0_seq1:78-1166(-)
MMKVLTLFLLATVAATNADKPVQVFILLGQSNMLGEGRKTGDSSVTSLVANGTGKYPYLWDKAKGNWSVSENVRSVFLMASGGNTSAITLFNNEFMTAAPTIPGAIDTTPATKPEMKTSIGPELGIGFALDNYTSDPVMCLKSCIGGRSLGWDLLPPTQTSFDYTDPTTNTVFTYAGYHQSPNRWVKGTTPKPIGWDAGIQYDGDTFRADAVLSNLTTYYPGASGYEVAGFFWWQGSKDAYDMALADHYEENLVALIKALRLRYKAPNAKFVAATLGQTLQNQTDWQNTTEGVIFHAQEAVDGTGKYGPVKYPEFKGNVATVYSHPLSMGSTSQNHYGGNAETYMNIGEAMGKAMVDLLKAE